MYEQGINEISVEDYTNYLEAAHKYNEELYEGKVVEDDDEDYLKQLKVPNTDIMGYIYIEKLNIDLPIYHGMEDGILQVGIGHFPASSLPIGGTGTHSALLGHKELPTAKLFTQLDKLELGDINKKKILKEKLLLI